MALVSTTKPRSSSISASSAPATLASILARIEVSRLLWWISGSSASARARRTLEVIGVMPAGSYTGDLCSARTIGVGPLWFDARGFLTWCAACSWTGEIVKMSRTIGHAGTGKV